MTPSPHRPPGGLTWGARPIEAGWRQIDQPPHEGFRFCRNLASMVDVIDEAGVAHQDEGNVLACLLPGCRTGRQGRQKSRMQAFELLRGIGHCSLQTGVATIARQQDPHGIGVGLQQLIRQLQTRNVQEPGELVPGRTGFSAAPGSIRMTSRRSIGPDRQGRHRETAQGRVAEDAGADQHGGGPGGHTPVGHCPLPGAGRSRDWGTLEQRLSGREGGDGGSNFGHG